MQDKINTTSQIIKLVNKLLRTTGSDNHVVPRIYGASSRKQYDIREQEYFHKIANSAIEDKRTLLFYDRLYTLYQGIIQASKCASSNSYFNTIEVGVYKGGGSKFICESAKALNRNISHFSIDTFEGHSKDDIKPTSDGWHAQGTFQETSFESVQQYLREYNFATVIKGRVQEVYDDALRFAKEFHFAHLDVDIEAPTMFMLERFVSDMPSGGIIVIDDYGFRSCPGMRDAVKEFAMQGNIFIGMELMTGQALLIKR